MKVPLGVMFSLAVLPFLVHELETWLALTLLLTSGAAFLWWLWGDDPRSDDEKFAEHLGEEEDC